MAGHWQQEQQFTIAPAGTARFTLNRNAPLERLTIWAISNRRTINMSFQVQINRQNYNAPVAIAAVAAETIYRSGGANNEDDLIPLQPAAKITLGSVDPFEFSVLITNAAGTTDAVTIYAVALVHQA